MTSSGGVEAAQMRATVDLDAVTALLDAAEQNEGWRQYLRADVVHGPWLRSLVAEVADLRAKVDAVRAVCGSWDERSRDRILAALGGAGQDDRETTSE